MYINADWIIQAAAVVTALAAISAVLRKIYLWFARQERQNDAQWRAIHQSYGVRACLMGLIEQGCDGPCKDALSKLDKHLNQAAHQNDGAKQG